jgi:beta-glucuronidase
LPSVLKRKSLRYLLGACIFALARVALAQPAPPNLIANIASRRAVSLDGSWSVIVDPYETGMGSHAYLTPLPKTKSDLVEFNFAVAGTLKVPGDWNTQRQELLLYEGPVWYQRYFISSKPAHRRVFLCFEAANYRARVWLNGEKLGEHTGGFTPFQFEVTGGLREGQNSLVVEVDNTRHTEGVPTLNSDWWNYGGLTRGVRLVELPESFIQDYLVQLAKGSSSEIAGWVKLLGATQPESVTVEIPELALKKAFTTDASGAAQFHFPAKPQLWTPEAPKLYQVRLSAGGDAIGDAIEDQIGFRTIETRGTQILLNGKPIYLRGVSMHEEAPFRSGRAFSEEDDRTLLTWAKELGCNFVRLAHYPYNESMIRLADRMGLLVWEEVPVYWNIAWENAATLENAEEQMRDLIARDHNRAATIFWSLSNETAPLSPARLDFLKSLAVYARSLDDTRLITSAMNHFDKDGDVRSINDPLGQYLDVLGLNEYLGWYEGRPEDADHTQWKMIYDKPLIVSEFGAGAVYGRHGDADERFTEEYQANLFAHQLKMWQRVPAVAGMSPWVLMDFRSPRRPLAGTQDFFNRKGLISDRGQRKQAFYVLQKFYQEKAK